MSLPGEPFLTLGTPADTIETRGGNRRLFGIGIGESHRNRTGIEVFHCICRQRSDSAHFVENRGLQSLDSAYSGLASIFDRTYLTPFTPSCSSHRRTSNSSFARTCPDCHCIVSCSVGGANYSFQRTNNESRPFRTESIIPSRCFLCFSSDETIPMTSAALSPPRCRYLAIPKHTQEAALLDERTVGQARARSPVEPTRSANAGLAKGKGLGLTRLLPYSGLALLKARV